MNWIDKLEKRFGGLAVPNLALYLIVGQVFVFAGIHFGRIDINLLYLNIPSILNGQVWRIFSFLFIPPATFSPIFLAFAWYIFWMISLHSILVVFSNLNKTIINGRFGSANP